MKRQYRKLGKRKFIAMTLLWLLIAATPAWPESIAVSIIKAGGDPGAAVTQAILAGEDPLQVAAAATAFVPDAAGDIAQTILRNSPELAYEIAFVVGKLASPQAAATLVEVIAKTNPASDSEIVSAIVSNAPQTQDDEVLVVSVLVDSQTNRRQVVTSAKPSQEGKTEINVVVEQNVGTIEAETPQADSDTSDTGSDDTDQDTSDQDTSTGDSSESGPEVEDQTPSSPDLPPAEHEIPDFDDEDPSTT